MMRNVHILKGAIKLKYGTNKLEGVGQFVRKNGSEF